MGNTDSIEFMEDFVKKYVDQLFEVTSDYFGIPKGSIVRLVGIAKYGSQYYFLAEMEAKHGAIGNFYEMQKDSNTYISWRSQLPMKFDQTYIRLTSNEFEFCGGGGSQKIKPVELGVNVPTFWNF